MIKIVDRAMYLFQGDTATANFDAENLGLTISQTDKLLFLVADKSKNEIIREVLSPNEAGVFVLNFTDTADIPVGEYLWQVRQYTNGVVDEGGTLTGDAVNTPFGPQLFKVMEVLGDGTVHA